MNSADISDEEMAEWRRETVLIRLTGACPYCDGSIDTRAERMPDDRRVWDHECTDCHEQWVVLEETFQ
jgi:hypothetical protein